MEHNKFNLFQNRITKLPPGFRFQPTDEELVFEYLKRKILSLPLPASIIPDINLCNYDPWDLPGDSEKYFFSSNEVKYPNGNRVNRCTPSGYWKSTGVDKQIGSSNIVGMRKTLVFYRGRHPYSSKTEWIMHEYRVVSINLTNQNYSNHVENWVLCRIFSKNKSIEREDIKEPMFFDFMNNRDYELSVCSSSSNSSSITDEVSSM